MRHKLTQVYLLLILLFALPSVGAKADNHNQEAIKISLLTCSPSPEVYGLFGHTAIRVEYPKYNYDLVFNYGMFSFDTPNFIYRFVKGETDYWVGAVDYTSFAMQYGMRGIGVKAQQLNLTQERSLELFEALLLNCEPENRVYRYNFLADNCTTRARDIIVNQLGDQLDYNRRVKRTTYREMLGDYLIYNPWTQLGINLVLGKPLDETLTLNEEMFLPKELQQAFKQARIVTPDTIVPLVAQSEILLPVANKEELTQETPTYLMPVVIFAILLVLLTLLSVAEMYKGRVFRLVDTLLFSVYGLVGVVIFFLMFISTHPATSPNYVALWLNPFALLVPILVWVKPLHKVLQGYYLLNLFAIAIYLLGWNSLSQGHQPVFILIALLPLVRSLINIIVYMQHAHK